MNDTPGLAPLLLIVLLAAVLWYITFGLADFGNFWVKISASAAILAVISLILMGRDRKSEFAIKLEHLVVGVLSAAVLYGVFALGDFVMVQLFPGFAPQEISDVYARKIGTAPWIVALLLLFITGPSEEIFWRGFLQKRLVKLMGPIGGLLVAAAIYSLVHIWTFNLSLLLAAFTAGLIWGFIYWRAKCLVPVIISHSLWSAAIFVFFPLH